MTRPSPREIERRLRRTDPPPPPPELLERLRDDIPERPAARERSGDAGSPEPAERSTSRRQWKIAASTILLVGIGGWLAWRTAERPSTREALEETVAGGDERAGSRTDPPPRATPGGGSPEVSGGLRSGEAPAGPTSPAPVDSTSGGSEARAGDAAGSGERKAAAGTAPREEPASAPERPRDTDVVFGIPAPKPTAPGARPAREAAAMPKPKAPPPPSAPRQEPRERAVAAAELVDGPRPPEPRPLPGPPPSTGGTAEPNDAPYGDMFFRHYGVNPFVDTEDDPLSTFGLDVDSGSYTLLRRYLEEGNLPPAEAIRVEELINYFDYGDAPPAAGDFALHAEAGPAPFADGDRYKLLRFGIRARRVTAAERRPATLIFVVDVSGSMERGDRLGLVRRSLRLLLGELRPDDRVGLVVYGSRGEVLLEPTGDLRAIERAVDGLTPGGSTNAEEGLALAYELIGRHLREGAIHRILLCSDGVANVGRTGAGSILERIGEAAARGVELTTVGFGLGNYNDTLMEQLADRGDGRYAYVDDLGEARRIFVEELAGTLETVATDAKVQVELDPATVSRYRLLGYENRDIADERFRDDSVDAGEVGAGHAVTALYEIKLREDAPAGGRLATLRLRWRSQRTGEVFELERSVEGEEVAPSWEAAPRALRLAAIVAELGEILRGSYWAKEGDLDELLVHAQRVSAEHPGEAKVAELAALVGKAAALAD